MAKNFAVDFRGRVPRIIKNTDEIATLGHEPGVVVNPDLSHVRGVSPSFWKLDLNGTILAVDPNIAIEVDRISMYEAGLNRTVEKIDFSTVRDEIDSKLKIILSSQEPMIRGIRKELAAIKSLLKLAALLLVSLTGYLIIRGLS